MSDPNEITVLYAGNWISVDEYEKTPEAIAAQEASRKSIAEQIEAGGAGFPEGYG